MSLSVIIKELSKIGIEPAEDRTIRNSKNMMVFLGSLMSLGGLLWGTILLALGLNIHSCIPYGYIVITFINLLYFHYSKKFNLARNIQILASMLLPFALQWSLGGYLSSGVVMLWSILSLYGANILKKGKGDVRWFLIFIGFCSFSFWLDPYIEHFQPASFTNRISALLSFINVSCITSIIFFLSKTYVKKNKDLLDNNGRLRNIQKKMALQSKKLEQNNHELLRYQRRINESINAAKTIQQAFLPDYLTLDSAFEEFFILFRPKDIVSGDFYWMHKIESKIIFIEADCTGHGVPGAFMTVIGNTVFNQIVKIEKEYDPASIMYKVDNSLKSILQQDISQNRDGMDLSILVIEEKRDCLEIEFGGSYQRLDYVVNNKLKTLKGSRKRIGGLENPKKEFETNRILLPKEAILYLYSDGLIDQNNPNGKRYGSESFKKLLEKVGSLPLKEQKEEIINSLENHQQGTEQRDDITLIGLKYGNGGKTNTNNLITNSEQKYTL